MSVMPFAIRTLVWITLAGACCRAQARPDVQEILSRVAETYGNLSFYHFKVTEYPYHDRFAVPGDFPGFVLPRDDSYVMDFAGARPDKFAMKRLWGTLVRHRWST